MTTPGEALDTGLAAVEALGDISAINTQLADLVRLYGVVQGQVNVLDGNAVALAARVAALESAVAGLTSGRIVDQAAISALGTRMTAAETAATALVARVYTLEHPPPPPAPTGGLHVEANLIKDAAGARFVFNGINEYAITPTMNAGRPDSDPSSPVTLYNSRDARFARWKALGANAIRVPIQSGTGAGSTDNATWLARLDGIVASAKAQGLFTMFTGFPASTTPPASAAYLGALAARYKAEPYVILEPWNEPYSITDAQLKTSMQPLITAILNAGFTGLIMVDTNSWSWQPAPTVGAWAVPMKPAQIVIASHRYSNANTFAQAQASIDADVKAYVGQYPIVGTEWGNWNGIQNGVPMINQDWSTKVPPYVRGTLIPAGFGGVFWFAGIWWDPNTMTDTIYQDGSGWHGSGNLSNWNQGLNWWGAAALNKSVGA